ncbi:hypothetical protein [Pikeienuella sp. HZG-20]|uniref:hypothetical protein n=1 Tax=Paludibacillus litoralis TaxID=3133267 RepID=UPI0030ED77A1
MIRALVCLAAALWSLPALAGNAEVVAAAAAREGATWRFDVAIRHEDEGWDHYADAWRVVGPDGAVYGERTLLHPHVDEQPFTRSLTGVRIPDGVGTVLIEAHDNVHGWSPTVVEFQLPD